MGRTKSMIGKLLDTLTGSSLKKAVEENSKTAADLKDAVAKARAKLDAERTAKEAKEAEEAKAAHAAKE